jgi:DNA-binding beta-propeller fold protein YncE
MQMRRSILSLAPFGVAALGLVAFAHPMEDFVSRAPAFQLSGRPVGGAKPATATAAFLTGSRIAAVDEGALVIDADSGNLIKTDKDGKPLTTLAIGDNPGMMVYDPRAKLAYVAARASNRVAVVKVSATKLELAQWITTPVEPYGIALSPDTKTVMVTTIADRALVAFDTASGKERWRTALGREPRGLAVSPDGTRALVAYLQTGTVDQIDLLETHSAEHVALSTAAAPRRCRHCGGTDGESFARAAFAVTFMGDHEAVVPYQRETPVQIASGGNAGSYGGGFEPPITHQLAFLGLERQRTTQATATIAQHQPRALAWDANHDALYVAGLGTDALLQVKNASQTGIAEGISANLTSGDHKCGADGLAITPEGNVLVWCSFTRNVERIVVIDAKGTLATTAKINPGPMLVASALGEKQHEGFVLFHSAEPAISQGGALACASCHPDGREDGLSWKIETNTLQTPLLAGRIVGTHPYKWDGGDKDLKTSLTTTMKRLGGFGLDKAQTANLAAYLEVLPAPRPPTRDVQMVARGKALFDSAEVGCRSCHDGATYSDQSTHKFQTSTLANADTPSLIGLAASAPYYHDGSAATLEALLRDRGAVHGMAETAKLSEQNISDLIAFLETI